MEIKVDTTGFDDVKDKFDDIDIKVMSTVGQTVKSDLLIGFKNETDPSGKKWKPLKPSTLKARRKKGRGAKILQDTANMKNSLNYKPKSGSVTVGYGMAYAVYHQSSRKILPTESSELDMEEIADIISRGFNV